jgi:hypothetical protein
VRHGAAGRLRDRSRHRGATAVPRPAGGRPRRSRCVLRPWRHLRTLPRVAPARGAGRHRPQGARAPAIPAPPCPWDDGRREPRPRRRHPRLHHRRVGHLLRDREGGADTHPGAAAAGGALLAGGGLLRLGALRPPRGRPALWLGLLAFAGFATQTIGLELTSASNAAFITGLAVVLTPMVAAVAWRRRWRRGPTWPRWWPWRAWPAHAGRGRRRGPQRRGPLGPRHGLGVRPLRRLPGRGGRAGLGVRAGGHAAPADGAARLGMGLAGARRARRRAALHLRRDRLPGGGVDRAGRRAADDGPARGGGAAGGAGVRARARVRRRLRRLVARRAAGPGRAGSAAAWRARRHQPRVTSTNTVTTSSRPAYMQNVSSALAAGWSPAKFSIGPTAPRPGPMLPRQAIAAEKAVTKSSSRAAPGRPSRSRTA